MRLTPDEELILHLEQRFDKENAIYMTKEEALEQLKFITEEDFGYDAAAWKKYFKETGLLTAMEKAAKIKKERRERRRQEME